MSEVYRKWGRSVRREGARLVRVDEAGEAVAQTRHFLWRHYRNLGGILYAYLNQYELYIADEAEIAALRN